MVDEEQFGSNGVIGGRIAAISVIE